MAEQEIPKPQVEVVGNPKKEEIKEVKPKEIDTIKYSKDQFNDIIEGRLARQKDSLIKEYGMTSEEAVKLKSLQDQADQQKEIEKGDFEKVLKKTKDTYSKEVETLRSQLSQVQINDALRGAASKYQSNAPDQVAQLLKPKIKLNKEGSVEVVDINGKVRYNDKGGQVTIPDLVQEFLNDYPHFHTNTPSGSGSVSAVGGKTVKPFNIKDLDMSKKEDREAYSKYRNERDSKPTQINLNK